MPSIPTLNTFHQPCPHCTANSLTYLYVLTLLPLEDTTSFQHCQGPWAEGEGCSVCWSWWWSLFCFDRVVFWMWHTPTIYLHAHTFEPLPHPQLAAILGKVVGLLTGEASLEEVSHWSRPRGFVAHPCFLWAIFLLLKGDQLPSSHPCLLNTNLDITMEEGS